MEKSLFQLCNGIHVTRNKPEVTFHYMENQGKATKFTVFFFHELPLNQSKNCLQKWISNIQTKEKQSPSVME